MVEGVKGGGKLDFLISRPVSVCPTEEVRLVPPLLQSPFSKGDESILELSLGAGSREEGEEWSIPMATG
jgi:hypothetical protein